jgi:heme/copper-type cytochrome/quinol oxidase subunit 2
MATPKVLVVVVHVVFRRNKNHQEYKPPVNRGVYAHAHWVVGFNEDQIA